MSNTILTVVITVHNADDCLTECLDSIEAQTYKDFKVLLVDDGSTDNSNKICLNRCINNKDWTLISQPNRGVSYARNLGLRLANTKWVFFLDCDDVFHQDFFSSMIGTAEASNADVVACKSRGFYETIDKSFSLPHACHYPLNVITPETNNGQLFSSFVGWAWDKLFKLSFLNEQKLFFPNLKNSEDLVFTYTALAKSQLTVICNEELIWHRLGRTSSISNSHTMYPNEFYKSIHALKRNLQTNPIIWAREEIGFYRWSLHFALWYAFSLKDKTTSKLIVKKLRSNAYPLLNLQGESTKHFRLVDLIILNSPLRTISILWRFSSLVSYIVRFGLYNTIQRAYFSLRK